MSGEQGFRSGFISIIGRSNTREPTHLKGIIGVLVEGIIFFLILTQAISASAGSRSSPLICTYEMLTWNVNQKNSNGLKKVQHPYSELTREEIDPETGCTVCSEDQAIISIPPLTPFSVCFKLAQRVHDVMSYLMQRGELIHAVVGYHVIKSRGPVDGNGNRTEFSNHSFGTAMDINPEQNGLYDNCIIFGPECRLLRGGEWHPGAPGTLEQNSEIVLQLKRHGFKWGGEIAGKQKDFMHFSLTGY